MVIFSSLGFVVFYDFHIFIAYYKPQTFTQMFTWKTKGGYRIVQLIGGRSNVFLVFYGTKKIMVDTSTKWNWNKLDKRLKLYAINEIDYLVLTHSHYDHAENARRIREKYHATVIVHKKESHFLLGKENIVPAGTNFFTRFLASFFGKWFFSLRKVTCPVDIVVDSTFSFHDFGFKAYLIHTPGHSEGSMSLIVDDEVAIVGDAMFGVFRWTVFPPFANNPRQLVDSWVPLLNTNCQVFLPSHGNANTRDMVLKDYEKRKIA